jgi:RNA ligase
MKDPILLNNLYKEVERDNVTVMSDGDLSIFKYTQACHIQGRWNAINRQARGLIMRADGTVVARPFAKFFNLGEVSETRLEALPWNESVEVYEKVDGSCGIGYIKSVTTDNFPGGTSLQWYLATPGSLQSEQAIEGTRILNRVAIQYDANHPLGCSMRPVYQLEHLPQDCTPVFEIVYPGNRIVVDYKGENFLSLLAIFELNGVEWHPRRVDRIAEACGFKRPRRYDLDIRQEVHFEENSEGYVVRFESGLRVKIKSPNYLRIHRLLNYLSPKGVIELIRGREYGSTLLSLPPHIVRDFDDIRAAAQTKFDEIMIYAAERLREMLSVVGENGSRKEKALWIQANVRNEVTGVVFGMLDDKDVKDGVWRIVQEQLTGADTYSKRVESAV